MRFGRKRSEAAAVIRSLRPFVFTRQTLPPVAVPVSQEILPGLLLAPVVEQGTRIDFLPPESIELLGGTKAVLDRAIHNLGIHPRPQVVPFEATPGDPDTTCYGLGSEDVFAASTIAGLDLLTAIVAPEVLPHYGILVAVPYWRLVLLHVLRGHGGLASLSRIAQMTDEMFRCSRSNTAGDHRPPPPLPWRRLPKIVLASNHGDHRAAASYFEPVTTRTVTISGCRIRRPGGWR